MIGNSFLKAKDEDQIKIRIIPGISYRELYPIETSNWNRMIAAKNI